MEPQEKHSAPHGRHNPTLMSGALGASQSDLGPGIGGSDGSGGVDLLLKSSNFRSLALSLQVPTTGVTLEALAVATEVALLMNRRQLMLLRSFRRFLARRFKKKRTREYMGIVE